MRPSAPLLPRVANQRLLVLTALVALLGAALWWPSTDDGARAQPRADAQQPYQCSQPGTGPQQRRQALALLNSDGRTGTGTMYPCVSGVMWNFSAGDVTSGDSRDAVATITGAYAAGKQEVFWAGSGSRELYHVAFEGLRFCEAAGVPDERCAGAVADVRMSASSATAPHPRPVQPYTLKITPDSAVTIGGDGVLTDLWTTGDSEIAVPLAQIPVGPIGCAIAGAEIQGDPVTGTCKVRVAAFERLNWLIGGSDYSLIGLDLNFAYLTTHRDGVNDPYDQPPLNGNGHPLDSVRLPETRIHVE